MQFFAIELIVLTLSGIMSMDSIYMYHISYGLCGKLDKRGQQVHNSKFELSYISNINAFFLCKMLIFISYMYLSVGTEEWAILYGNGLNGPKFRIFEYRTVARGSPCRLDGVLSCCTMPILLFKEWMPISIKFVSTNSLDFKWELQSIFSKLKESMCVYEGKGDIVINKFYFI